MADSEPKYYLAVDIGASSGRHILGSIEDGKIRMEEIHRFENGMKKIDGHRCWDVDGLFKEIVAGMKKCKEAGKIPVSMAIDTWAVDYVLLDKEGEIRTEYTNATTTQLVNPRTKVWDQELIDLLGLPAKIFGGITMAGTRVGGLKEDLKKEIGFDLDVVQAASHDTGSAVVSVPAEERDFLYISSGTWSLMGVECEEADYSEESRLHNFTNEGGYEYRYRYLKNIMGLWMQQSVKKEYENKYSYTELWEMAEKSGFDVTIDANDERLLAPESMIQAIQELCKEAGEKIPETPGEVVNVIARSLAECYKKTAEEIEALTGQRYPVIHIVGGGSQADYLCRLTAKATGKEVLAGPTEGTAVGNLVVQLLRDKRYRNIREARKAVGESFEIRRWSSCRERKS